MTPENTKLPVEERLALLLKDKTEMYSCAAAISDALFPTPKPGYDPVIGKSGESLISSASCVIPSKNSARRLAYTAMAEAAMKLSVRGVIPEAGSFIVTGGKNPVSREAAKGAHYFGNQLSFSCSRLDFSSETTESVVFVAIAEGYPNDKQPVSLDLVQKDQALFIFGAETDRSDLISPKELEMLSTATAELSVKPYILDLRYLAEGGIAYVSAQLGDSLDVGLVISESKIPAQHRHSNPDEILFSGTPGRCLAVVSKSHKNEIKKLLRSYSISFREIGTTNGSGVLEIRRGRSVVCSVSVDDIVFPHSATRTHLMPAKGLPAPTILDVSSLKQPQYFKSCLKTLLSSQDVIKEYQLLQDHSENVEIPTMSAQSGGRFWKLDPRQGAVLAVASAARQLAVTGVTPSSTVIGIPSTRDDTESVQILRETLAGFQVAIADLGLEIVSRQFIPLGYDPLVAVVGDPPDESHSLSQELKRPGDFILMLGSHRGELGGSTYLKEIHGREEGPPPVSDLVIEKRIHEILITGARVGLISSAAAVSRGGLAVILSHMILLSAEGIGARIHMSSKIRDDELLFGETQGLCVITVEEDAIMELERLCMQIGVTCTAIGRVTDKSLFTFNDLFSVKVSDLREAIK